MKWKCTLKIGSYCEGSSKNHISTKLRKLLEGDKSRAGLISAYFSDREFNFLNKKHLQFHSSFRRSGWLLNQVSKALQDEKINVLKFGC